MSVAGCGDRAKESAKYPGFFETEEGVHYRIHVVGESGRKPKENDWLELQMINSVADSVLYDSELDNARGTLLMPYSGNRYFSVLSEGDSATFILPAGGLFAYNYDSAAQLMNMSVKLVAIVSGEEAEKRNSVSSPDPELDEQKLMAVYLRKKKLQTQPDAEGIYLVSKKEGSGAAPEAGKTIVVKYRGLFLNGKSFDEPRGPVEFSWGAERQMLRGLELAVSKLKSGGEATVLLPSRLAFGKDGSGNGSVKPYTPVIYEVALLEVK